ncbi:MAG: hypothetical protein WC326_02000 [Candidatus Delongbacteria bacterium]
MTRESQSRRARRRRRETLRGQSHQMQDPGNLATHRARERWDAFQDAKERLQRKLDALARLAAIRSGRL